MRNPFTLSPNPRLTNPGDYVMPYGKHKGRKLATINRSQIGHEYLLWAVDRLDSQHVVEAIKTFLATK